MDIFGSSDSEEEEVYIDPIKRLAMKQAEEAKKVDEKIKKESKNEIYQYDEVYETLNESKKQEQEFQKKLKEKEKGKSKYIEKLLENSKERKLYQDHLKNQSMIKKNEEEKQIYGDTEVFYTKSYEEQLMKQKKLKEKFEQESTPNLNKSNFLNNILEPSGGLDDDFVTSKDEESDEKEMISDQLQMASKPQQEKKIEKIQKKKIGEKPTEEILSKARERAIERMNLRLKK
eukprot:gene1746-515_t